MKKNEEYDEIEEFESEDIEEMPEQDEDDVSELAPSSIIGYIKFMCNKNNKKDTLATMPKAIKSKFTRHIILIVLALALGLAMLLVYREFTMLIIAGLATVVIGILALRLYLIGTRRQYVQIQGIVVRSDYTKNVLEKAKNSLQRTSRADFRYNTFVVQTEDEYVKVTCNKAKELPQEGDAVRVTIPGSSKVYEEDGLTSITSYIDIERIA